jgi:hypothetical protein
MLVVVPVKLVVRGNKVPQILVKHVAVVGWSLAHRPVPSLHDTSINLPFFILRDQQFVPFTGLLIYAGP